MIRLSGKMSTITAGSESELRPTFEAITPLLPQPNN